MQRLLAAALLMMTAGGAIPFSGGSDDEVVERLDVRFEQTDQVGRSCHEAVARDREPGHALIRFQYAVSGAPERDSSRFSGHVRFSLGDVVITMPRALTWPNMTATDRIAAEKLVAAIRHHEIGHVRVAEALVDELNAHGSVTQPDQFAFHAAADALGRDGFTRFERLEDQYDEITDHGRRQRSAPGVLSGPDTAIVCT